MVGRRKPQPQAVNLVSFSEKLLSERFQTGRAVRRSRSHRLLLGNPRREARVSRAPALPARTMSGWTGSDFAEREKMDRGRNTARVSFRVIGVALLRLFPRPFQPCVELSGAGLSRAGWRPIREAGAEFTPIRRGGAAKHHPQPQPLVRRLVVGNGTAVAFDAAEARVPATGPHRSTPVKGRPNDTLRVTIGNHPPTHTAAAHAVTS